MADRFLKNQGVMNGIYAGATFEDSLSSELDVRLAEPKFTKTADQSVWFDGELTVKFTIDNTEGDGPFQTITIVDMLDNTKFKYIVDSLTAQIATTDVTPVVTELVLNTDFTVVYVENTAADPTKDSLTINFLAGGAGETIPVGSIATITFRGTKVPA